jgi:hypothetical protein
MSSGDLAESIVQSVWSVLENVNTCTMGVVVDYDKEKRTATVRSAIKRKQGDKETQRPNVYTVPVVFPSSSAFTLEFPIQEGDDVLLVFSQRNLDNWKEGGPGHAPPNNRKFNYGDAIAIPSPFSAVKSKPTTKLEITDAGLFKIENSNASYKKISDEIVDVLKQIQTELTTGLGNMGVPIAYSGLVDLGSKISTLETSIQQFTE